MPPLKRFASTGCTTAKTLGGKGTPCGQPGAEEYGQRAQPVSRAEKALAHGRASGSTNPGRLRSERDRKSTRLNSSHGYISYAVFCLKKKNNQPKNVTT